jgi:hypothetical protein
MSAVRSGDRVGLRVTVEGAKPLSAGVWLAKLSPGSASVFGEPAARVGDWTVVVLEGTPDYEKGGGSLAFDPGRARLLNVGATERLLVLAGATESHALKSGGHEAPRSARPAASRGGDREFLHALPEDLRELGEMLLSEVRHHFQGELRYYPDSRRFVETPDNFWTVTIRTRVHSLDITVRGAPGTFGPSSRIEIKNDRTGYSRFKLTSTHQIEEALRVIRRASMTGRRGAV